MLQTCYSSAMNYTERITIRDGFKRRCVSEKQEVNSEDRISGLPNDVLQHILSFLETKEAVMTGILSRRWRFLWTGISVLDFDDMSISRNQSTLWYSMAANHFMNFVERVLLLRDALNIKRFRLSCRAFFSVSRIHSWISAAVINKVEELDLCLLVQGRLLLPHSVFSSETLTRFKLCMNGILQLPEHISFPRLKVLHLGLLTFDKPLEKLFTSCPMLEELAMIECDWSALESITICIPSLRSLIIDDLPVFGPTGNSEDCEIKIHASELSSFVYCGYLTNDIVFSDLLTSVKVSVHIPNAYRLQEKVALRAVKLFERMQNVNSLKISNSTIEVNMLDHLPVFQQLTHLELTMNVKEHTFGSLIQFLKLFPKLEYLNFAKGVGSLFCLYRDDGISESFANCWLSCLKTVNLRYFNGNESEILLLKTLLTSSPCLERINLFSSDDPCRKFKDWGDLWNLLNESRGAKQCVFTIL